MYCIGSFFNGCRPSMMTLISCWAFQSSGAFDIIKVSFERLRRQQKSAPFWRIFWEELQSLHLPKGLYKIVSMQGRGTAHSIIKIELGNFAILQYIECSSFWIHWKYLESYTGWLPKSPYTQKNLYPKAPLPKSPYTQKPVYPKAVHKSSFLVNNPFLTPFWGP
jgi:hypothetical protein